MLPLSRLENSAKINQIWLRKSGKLKGKAMKLHNIGTRIEIPVHYDMWMRGARFGTVTKYREGSAGRSAFVYVQMDNPRAKSIKLWAIDWDYIKVLT